MYKCIKKEWTKNRQNLNVQNGSIIDISHCWLVSIGDNVTLAPNAHIFAHDASTQKFIKYTKIGKVEIGNNVFIGAGSVVLPNVKIGDNVIIGANSVVSKDIENNVVAAGNPARVINTLDNYLEKYKNVPEDLKFDKSYTISGGIDKEKKEEMIEKLDGVIGLVE